MTTIEDVYQRQDASDMFFNHEGITAAYAASVDDETLPEDRPLFTTGIINLGFSPEDAEVIARDFLKRL